MKKLSEKQRQLVAEFLSNTAVAAVAVGILNQLFTKPLEVLQLIQGTVISILIAGGLLFFSIKILRK